MRTLRQAAILKLKKLATTVDSNARFSRLGMADDIKGNEAAAQSLEIRTPLAMMQYGASDLHLSSGHHQLRVDGRLRQLR